MKKYGTFIALAVAVIFGIAAVILANKWMSTRVPETQLVVQEKVPLGKVVIAAKDMNIGSRLTRENLSLVDWPKANAPKGSFDNIEGVLDRVIVTRMVAGMPVVAAELAAPGSAAGLVAMIDPGMRAMAIRVDEVIGVGGFILPNTFVDVISVQGKTKVATTVLKSIEVLAVAQETFVEEGQAKLVRTVTLKLKPEQAEKLAETTHKGAIQLALRNSAEKEGVKAKPEIKKVASRGKRHVTRRVVRKPPYSVTVVRGGGSVERVTLRSAQ
jgi:pilus assembly protein CpaB